MYFDDVTQHYVWSFLVDTAYPIGGAVWGIIERNESRPTQIPESFVGKWSIEDHIDQVSKAALAWVAGVATEIDPYYRVGLVQACQEAKDVPEPMQYANMVSTILEVGLWTGVLDTETERANHYGDFDEVVAAMAWQA